MNRALNYIGLAKKAALLETGEENSHNAIKKGKVKLLIVASDASENAQKRAAGFVYADNIPLVTVPFTKQEISQITGKNGCSMAVFFDTGIASSFAAALFEMYGDEFTAIADSLREEHERSQSRKAKGSRGCKGTGKRRKNV